MHTHSDWVNQLYLISLHQAYFAWSQTHQVIEIYPYLDVYLSNYSSPNWLKCLRSECMCGCVCVCVCVCVCGEEDAEEVIDKWCSKLVSVFPIRRVKEENHLRTSLAFEDIFNTAMLDKNRSILLRLSPFSTNYRELVMNGFLWEELTIRSDGGIRGFSPLRKRDMVDYVCLRAQPLYPN